ncbi:MAG TPA: cytochrome c [Geomonas sp.]|nr:cytochrome c [Geomonas sp.]
MTDTILVVMAAVSFFLSIHSSGRVGTTIDGAALYATHCSKCHGAALTKSRLSTARITTAIANVGAMRSLSGLSISEIQAIAMASSATASASTPLPEAIYGGKCSFPPALELSSAGHNGQPRVSVRTGS